MQFQIGVRAAIVIAALLASSGAGAQQVVDSQFHPVVEHPAFEPQRGPVVMIDEAHFNIHTASGQYAPFAAVLRQDGYRVAPFKTKFTAKALTAGRVLVIANALTGDAVSWMPKSACKLEAGSPNVSVKGWQQGAVLHYGKGRIAFFGEAAMFTAQLLGPRQDPMGLNNPRARQNQQFLLNVVHWLTGVLK